MTAISKMAQVAGLLDHLEAPIDEKLAAIETLLSHFTLAMDPLVLAYKSYTVDGVADMTKTIHMLASGVDITGVDPLYVGQVIIVMAVASGTDPTATTTGTWNGAATIASFPDAYDVIVAVAISATRWLVLINLTGVSFA